MEKNIFKKFINWLKGLHGDLFNKFRNNSGIAVQIADKLKKIVESNILDIATDLIPGDLDDKILKKLKIIIPIVATKLAITHGILNEFDNNSDVIEKIIEYLKNTHSGLKVSFWVIFSAELNVALSDGELTLSEGISLSQLVYREMNKK